MDRLARRIADQAVLRLIWRHLQAGIMADGMVMAREREETRSGSGIQASVSRLLPSALVRKYRQDCCCSEGTRHVQTAYPAHHQTRWRPGHNPDCRTDADIPSRLEVLIPAGTNPRRYSKIWIRGYVTESGLSSLSTGARDRQSTIASAVSGLPMSRPHLWQEAWGTGGDTAKLG